jgi:hypothetical protein
MNSMFSLLIRLYRSLSAFERGGDMPGMGCTPPFKTASVNSWQKIPAGYFLIPLKIKSVMFRAVSSVETGLLKMALFMHECSMAPKMVFLMQAGEISRRISPAFTPWSMSSMMIVLRVRTCW